MSGVIPAPGGPWYPPRPSLASLPVDRTKTEPTPAYYKLQFGDDVTGFSYYVRTLAVVIGRNCERAVPVPPPAITSPSVPPIPPLGDHEDTQKSLVASELGHHSVPVDQAPSPNSLPKTAEYPSDPLPSHHELSPLRSQITAPEQDDHFGAAFAAAPAVTANLSRKVDSPPDIEATAIVDPVKMELQHIHRADEGKETEVKPEPGDDCIFVAPYDPEAPPPPPREASTDLAHVDVDLGPLKSVSRNHARIEYRSDLCRFCLEIYGRNGAWVDDRYYIRGSIVPLYQRSQVQIATRIFSFILPPSPMTSPAYTHYGFDSTPRDAKHTLEDLPYPYNLPPTEVGYREFYGKAGPGPETMAGRVPETFSAFAAADGHGLGIDGVGEDRWLDHWDSEAESDESEDSYDEDSERSHEDRSSDIADGESDLASLSSTGDDHEEEGESVQSDRGARQKRTKSEKRPESDVSASHTGEVGTTMERKGVKRPVKNVKAQIGAKGKGGESHKADVPDEPVKRAAPVKRNTNSKTKFPKQEGGPLSTNSEKPPVPEKGSKKSAKLPPAIVAYSAEGGTSEAAATRLPVAIVTAPVVSAKTALKEIPPPMSGAPSSHSSTQAPASAAQAITKLPLAPTPLVSIPAGPRQLSSQARSILSPSPTGSTEVQRPFYLTELIETPGQPGHIVVNVPIPPSGAGPRPPPGPAIGLDGQPFIGPAALKPTATFASIIHRALVNLPRGRGTLGEVCNWVAGEWEWFRLNVDSVWQNSIRHNLSLNKAFLKVPRIPEDDPESKGSVWIIDPDEGPAFEEKQRRDAEKAVGKVKNPEIRRDKDRKEDRPRPMLSRPMPPQRAMAVTARTLPRPTLPPPPPAAPAIVSANAKGILQPKAKIIVVIQPITPAMRAKTVISTSDVSGNPLPFVCDGTTLVLEQETFGHLTNDITDKLTLLGAAGAVDVLSAWVINKNKQQLAKAQAGASVPVKGSIQSIPPTKVTKLNAAPCLKNGLAPNHTTNTVQPPKAAIPIKHATATQTLNSGPKPGQTKATIAAPLGASLTKVIGMIAEVANAKGDVNTVGPNASALLKYIRVVGVDIDLHVAERIWATGVLPLLPGKNTVPKAPVVVNGVKRKLGAEDVVGSAGIEGGAKKSRMEASSA